MEKKDLEISHNGTVIGAFAGIKEFEEKENVFGRKRLEFTCDDGTFVFDEDRFGDFVCDRQLTETTDPRITLLTFDTYKLQVRRTTKKHFDKNKRSAEEAGITTTVLDDPELETPEEEIED